MPGHAEWVKNLHGVGGGAARKRVQISEGRYFQDHHRPADQPKVKPRPSAHRQQQTENCQHGREPTVILKQRVDVRRNWILPLVNVNTADERQNTNDPRQTQGNRQRRDREGEGRVLFCRRPVARQPDGEIKRNVGHQQMYDAVRMRKRQAGERDDGQRNIQRMRLARRAKEKHKDRRRQKIPQHVGVSRIHRRAEQRETDHRKDRRPRAGARAAELAAHRVHAADGRHRQSVTQPQHHQRHRRAAGQIGELRREQKERGRIQILNFRPEGSERRDASAQAHGERQQAEALRVGVEWKRNDKSRDEENGGSGRPPEKRHGPMTPRPRDPLGYKTRSSPQPQR